MTTNKEAIIYNGYLYAKLERVGSFSQGPEYYLQILDGKNLHIIKRVQLWEEDPVLHGLLGEMVTVAGGLTEHGIAYEEVSLMSVPTRTPLLTLTPELPDNTLWVHHEGAPHTLRFPPRLRHVTFDLSVHWPYRSIWHAECPTSQLFDVWIEDAMGRELWQWSESMLFDPHPVKVEVPGGSPLVARVKWFFYDHVLTEEGRYIARFRFLPTGEEVTRDFQVRFVKVGEVVA